MFIYIPFLEFTVHIDASVKCRTINIYILNSNNCMHPSSEGEMVGNPQKLICCADYLF